MSVFDLEGNEEYFSRNNKVTVTAILTAAQALLAANSGAAYVAPYVSRLENVFGDGVGTVADIARLLKTSKSNTQILAASFKTAREALDCALADCHCATIGSETLARFLKHATTTSSISGFVRSSSSLNSSNCTIILPILKNSHYYLL